MTENDDGEGIRPESETAEPDTAPTGDRRRTINRIVTVVLLVALAVLLVGTIYVTVNPIRTTDPYTELYLLGPEGGASNYPTQLEPGEEGTVIVGITNHEGERVTYHLRVLTRNRTVATHSPSLANEETWEQNVSFQLEAPGRHRVRFLLYKDSPSNTSGDPYLTTRLVVTVGEKTDTPAAVVERPATDLDADSLPPGRGSIGERGART